MQLWLILLVLLVVGGARGQEIGMDNPISEEGQAWLSSLFTLPTEPRVRQEYRTLSEGDRQKFHLAFQLLKNDTSVEPNKFDLLVSLHARRSTRNSAHRGPGFLGWHRLYMLLVENALRQMVDGITLCYWDSALEGEMAKPHLSSIWTEDFMGRGDGDVDNGPFAGWETQEGTLYRTVGIRYWPMTHENISVLMEKEHIGDISYPNADDVMERTSNYEKLHNNVHNWIGGEMKVIETAGDDPIFYVYHTFVDLIWEQFRRKQRTRGIDPVTDYAEYYGHARHHMFSPMGLGNLLAIDGQSEVFSRNIVYMPRPTCSLDNPSCNSIYLWCDLSKKRCLPWTTQELNELKALATDNGVTISEQAERYKRDLYETNLAELQRDGVIKALGSPLGNSEEEDIEIVTDERKHHEMEFEVDGDDHDSHVHNHPSQLIGEYQEEFNPGKWYNNTLLSTIILIASVAALTLLSVCTKIMSRPPRDLSPTPNNEVAVTAIIQRGFSESETTERNGHHNQTPQRKDDREEFVNNTNSNGYHKSYDNIAYRVENSSLNGAQPETDMTSEGTDKTDDNSADYIVSEKISLDKYKLFNREMSVIEEEDTSAHEVADEPGDTTQHPTSNGAIKHGDTCVNENEFTLKGTENGEGKWEGIHETQQTTAEYVTVDETGKLMVERVSHATGETTPSGPGEVTQYGGTQNISGETTEVDEVISTADDYESLSESLSQLQLQLEMMDDNYFDSIINGINL